jgi:hypothetical protein
MFGLRSEESILSVANLNQTGAPGAGLAYWLTIFSASEGRYDQYRSLG